MNRWPLSRMAAPISSDRLGSMARAWSPVSIELDVAGRRVDVLDLLEEGHPLAACGRTRGTTWPHGCRPARRRPCSRSKLSSDRSLTGHQRTHGLLPGLHRRVAGEAGDELEELGVGARRHVDRRGRGSTARRPYLRTAGSGSGVAMPGVSQPALPHDEPAATPSRSRTVTSTPCSWRNQAVDRPTMPAPTTATRWGTGRPAAVTGPCVDSCVQRAVCLPLWSG